MLTFLCVLSTHEALNLRQEKAGISAGYKNIARITKAMSYVTIYLRTSFIVGVAEIVRTVTIFTGGQSNRETFERFFLGTLHPLNSNC